MRTVKSTKKVDTTTSDKISLPDVEDRRLPDTATVDADRLERAEAIKKAREDHLAAIDIVLEMTMYYGRIKSLKSTIDASDPAEDDVAVQSVYKDTLVLIGSFTRKFRKTKKRFKTTLVDLRRTYIVKHLTIHVESMCDEIDEIEMSLDD